jgi:metal-responsive CopG/Arc/MetJ family transcriptional regulator
MKTTVDLPEALLEEVRDVADQRGWTVRVVFEESLRAFLERQKTEAESQPFTLAHTIVGGSELPDLSFAQMLEATDPDRRSE